MFHGRVIQVCYITGCVKDGKIMCTYIFFWVKYIKNDLHNLVILDPHSILLIPEVSCLLLVLCTVGFQLEDPELFRHCLYHSKCNCYGCKKSRALGTEQNETVIKHLNSIYSPVLSGFRFFCSIKQN